MKHHRPHRAARFDGYWDLAEGERRRLLAKLVRHYVRVMLETADRRYWAQGGSDWLDSWGDDGPVEERRAGTGA